MSGDYLFDKHGAAPADVVRLERLLGRFAHRPAPRVPRAIVRRRWPWVLGVLAAAAGVAMLVRGWTSESAPATVEVVQAGGTRLRVDDWVRAEADQQLDLPAIGWVKLAAGAQLQARQLDRDQARFWLEAGRMEAFVRPTVKARFFQVETLATTCIDLGCKYVLEVDPQSKVATVQVTLGLVAFADAGREVLVPRGASCRAEPGRGAGTPRFPGGTVEVRDRLDAFDAASDPEARGALAEQIARAAGNALDTLPLWHLLQTAPAAARAAVEAALVRLVGPPAGERSVAAWRGHLDAYWWGG